MANQTMIPRLSPGSVRYKSSYRADAGGPMQPSYLNTPGIAGITGSYMRGESSPLLWAWNPVLREPVDEVGMAWGRAAARMIDALHNSGWLKGGVDTAVAQMIGDGLQLQPKPDPTLFNNDAKAARTWGQDIKRRWDAWANDPYSCDLSGRFPIGQLCAQGVRQWFATGEILATLPYKPRPGASHGTKLNVIPSSRLTPGGANNRNVQGVILDADGVPFAYNITNRDLATNRTEEVEVQARDENGRPVVIHVFDGEPTQVRGITPLTAVLNPIRQYDQLANATLMSALVQTIVSGVITSDQPSADLINALSSPEEMDAGDAEETDATPGAFDNLLKMKGEWYSKTKIDMGQFGKFVHLFPGESLDLKRAEHPNTGYESFTKGLLREVARCFGLTYEQLTGDYIGATYSSVRMATADMWLLNVFRRHYIAARLMQAVYESWLEEEFELNPGLLPGGLAQFFAQRQLICRADWRGPPRPTADDLKTAKAQQVMRQERWMSRNQLCAEYGNDWLDNQEAAQQEMEDDNERGLPPLPSAGPGGAAGLGGFGDQQDAQDGNKADASLGVRLDRALQAEDDSELFDVMADIETRVATVAQRSGV
jgi:lambda family phage portal protein